MKALVGGDDWSPFSISYRTLVKKKNKCTNLLTPTCPSSSDVAYGAIRIEFTFMALGQACAIAVVIAIEKNKKCRMLTTKNCGRSLVKTSR